MIINQPQVFICAGMTGRGVRRIISPLNMEYRPNLRMSRKSTTYRLPPENGNYDLNASAFGVSFIILSTFVIVFALLVNNCLPVPFGSQDDDLESRRFIAGRAFDIVQNLSSIGPKVTGTYENEVLAVDFIKEQIEKIIYLSSGRHSSVEYDVQISSGCYRAGGVYKCYHNIQNVVVKLTSEKAAEEYIMLNSHFDSVPSSPGASDDGVNCAIMLEILRLLAVGRVPLKRNVIFLFNGAEEDGLLGSHGFITQHRWAKNIVAFINLDACGAGGQEVLFQTGPKAAVLPQIYAKSVPHPYGTVIGEELFQSGALPSDTDFRNFRDFGNLKGLDMAHFRNGYVYHTSNDDISYVTESVIQHTGDNVLSLLRALIEKENLKKEIDNEQEQAVFFDVFGYFMICYSMKTAFIVNVAIVLLSVTTSTYMTVRIFKGKKVGNLFFHFSINFFFLSASFLATALVLYSMSELLKWKGLTMLWYSNQWFICAYYCLAALYTFATVLRIRRYFIYSALNVECETQLFIIILQMVVTLIVFLGTLLHIRSVVFLTMGLIGVSVSHVVVNAFLKNAATGLKVIVYVACNLFPLMYVSYLFVPLIRLVVPMLGRIGVDVDSETIIWILCDVLTIFALVYFLPLVLLVKQWWKIELCVVLCYAVFVTVVVFSSVLSPFESETPERFDVLHVNRIIAHSNNVSKTENSGYLVVPLDMRAPQTVNLLFGDMDFSRVSKLCDEDLMCALPLTKNGFRNENFKKSFWTEREKPSIPESRKMEFSSTSDENFKTFNITLSGAAFANIFVFPLNNAELVGWSLTSDKPEGSTTWQNQTVFIIQYVRGRAEVREWSFWLRLNTSQVIPNVPVFKLAWSSQYRITTTSHFTEGFRKLINRFPSWTKAVFSVADHEEYLF